jgi:hypothetical protein
MDEVYKLTTSVGNSYTFEEVSRYHTASVYIGIPDGLRLGGNITLILDNPPPLVQNTIVKFFIYHGQEETATPDNSGEPSSSSGTPSVGSGPTIQPAESSSVSTDSEGLSDSASSPATTVPTEPTAIHERTRPTKVKSPTATASGT